MQQPEKNVKPNLPGNEVTIAAVGNIYTDTIKALNSLNIEVYKINKNSKLPDYLSSHADMNMFHFSENELFFENGKKTGELNKFYTISSIIGDLNAEYPKDCLLNSVVIDNKIIVNERSVDSRILKAAESAGLTIISTNQGYSKCSVCPVTANSIITDDISIYKSAQNFFNDVLFIEKGSIRLEGTNYGFIGGATGKISHNKIAFNGRLESHTDHNKIIDFLSKYNIEVIELINDRLTDIGSIIPLREKA